MNEENKKTKSHKAGKIFTVLIGQILVWYVLTAFLLNEHVNPLILSTGGTIIIAIIYVCTGNYIFEYIDSIVS